MRCLFAALAVLLWQCSQAGSAIPHRPGTLLLNMLIKDESAHLDRTLPAWAKIIDYWVIGVDRLNTDDSAEIIHKHLGHIPGEIVVVDFDGMGPTWTILVEHGVANFPEATHGIIADADFKPMEGTLDKWQLDVRCSKHMYTIWTGDHSNARKMDWIYRNIPGARVERRVHQTVKVPALPDQEVFQTLIDLQIEEQTGGYQDRTGTKMLNYIKWLEKDLEEFPEDPRTLYYLGYSHFEIFLKNRHAPTQYHWDVLEKSVGFYKRRAAVQGNFEEKWFALLKLGEIYERFYRDEDESFKYYQLCADQDPERADPLFYMGQFHRLRKAPLKALRHLDNAAKLEIPDRSLFTWKTLYTCLSKLEFARAVDLLPTFRPKVVKRALRYLLVATCVETEDDSTVEEYRNLIAKFRQQLADQPKAPEMDLSGESNVGNELLQVFNDNKHYLAFHLGTDRMEVLEPLVMESGADECGQKLVSYFESHKAELIELLQDKELVDTFDSLINKLPTSCKIDK